MRPHLGLLLLATLALSMTTAGARTWVDSPVSVPACEDRADAELDCGLAACRGYGTAADYDNLTSLDIKIYRKIAHDHQFQNDCNPSKFFHLAQDSKKIEGQGRIEFSAGHP